MRTSALSRMEGLREALNCLALVLALTAVAAQAVAPICLYADLVPHSSGGIPIVLCTAHGFETVALDATGKPVAPSPDKGGSDGLCPMCIAFHAAPPLALASGFLFSILLVWRSADRILDFSAIVLRPAFSSFITRGPPFAIR